MDNDNIQIYNMPKSVVYRNKKMTKEESDIISTIESIKNQLDMARHKFDIVTDESLIDSYIYEMISLNKKYQYYIKLAKEIGLVAKGFEKTVLR